MENTEFMSLFWNDLQHATAQMKENGAKILGQSGKTTGLVTLCLYNP